MVDEYTYPMQKSVAAVLTKIGIDPSSRDLLCQDLEYTTCLVSELPDYYDLYRLKSTTDQEKLILGCFFLECLNDHVSESEVEHPLQRKIVELLYADIRIHKAEIDYRTENEHNNEECTWPIRKYLLSMAPLT